MKTVSKKHNKALTLIEVMIVVLIIAVAVIGAMGFRFYCVRDAKMGDVQVNAARIGLTLLESWNGAGGYKLSDYVVGQDPISRLQTYGLNIVSGTGPARPADMSNTFGSYHIIDNAGVHYYAVLSYNETALRPLNVSIVWRDDYSPGALTGNERRISITAYN